MSGALGEAGGRIVPPDVRPRCELVGITFDVVLITAEVVQVISALGMIASAARTVAS